MSTSPNSADSVRHDWTTDEARTLFALPFNDLLFRAQAAHRQFFDPNRVQMSNLLSVKTGGCPEDCSYCPQSAKFDTGTKAEKLMDVNTVVAQAEQAKAGGAPGAFAGTGVPLARRSLPDGTGPPYRTPPLRSQACSTAATPRSPG